MAPLHGILEELAGRPHPPRITLVYSVHHESELLFRTEIDEWFNRIEGWRKVYVVTAQPEWQGERGRVTAERLAQWCGEDLDRAIFYLCGPVGMLWAVRRGLRGRGVPRRRIRSEQFVFLP
jgi:ferredoxin-NADP reductase